jgi:geranylgeranyl diphosphate synthase, type II
MIRHMTDLKTYLHTAAADVNAALDRLLPPAAEPPANLHAAMRYSLFAGGKRLRPVLCIAACEACGGSAAQAMDAACALEVLHTYTLIHDDLPAMDDDTLRRGKPTCHVQFDEATAILAGDALLTLSFEILAGIPETGSRLVPELARAAGSRGVIGGQAADLVAEGRPPDAVTVEYIHRHKTAALIRAACVIGGRCARAPDETLDHLARCGEACGLAFQIADDLLDESATVEELGKDIGSDRENGKMTWLAVHGTEEARAEAARLTQVACAEADALPDGTRLRSLIDWMLGRTS